MSNSALATLDLDLCIARLAAGCLTKTIAAELGIPKPTLRNKLVKHPGYQAAIQSQAESIVETAVEEMMAKELIADSAVIARARARVDTAFKYAAARDPAVWGQHTQVEIGITEQLGDVLQRLSERKQGRLIDAQQSIEAESVVKNVVTPRDGEDDAQSDQ